MAYGRLSSAAASESLIDALGHGWGGVDEGQAMNAMPEEHALARTRTHSHATTLSRPFRNEPQAHTPRGRLACDRQLHRVHFPHGPPPTAHHPRRGFHCPSP
jgi:hypothetical protein